MYAPKNIHELKEKISFLQRPLKEAKTLRELQKKKNIEPIVTAALGIFRAYHDHLTSLQTWYAQSFHSAEEPAEQLPTLLEPNSFNNVFLETARNYTDKLTEGKLSEHRKDIEQQIEMVANYTQEEDCLNIALYLYDCLQNIGHSLNKIQDEAQQALTKKQEAIATRSTGIIPAAPKLSEERWTPTPRAPKQKTPKPVLPTQPARKPGAGVAALLTNPWFHRIPSALAFVSIVALSGVALHRTAGNSLDTAAATQKSLTQINVAQLYGNLTAEEQIRIDAYNRKPLGERVGEFDDSDSAMLSSLISDFDKAADINDAFGMITSAVTFTDLYSTAVSNLADAGLSAETRKQREHDLMKTLLSFEKRARLCDAATVATLVLDQPAGVQMSISGENGTLRIQTTTPPDVEPTFNVNPYAIQDRTLIEQLGVKNDARAVPSNLQPGNSATAGRYRFTRNNVGGIERKVNPATGLPINNARQNFR